LVAVGIHGKAYMHLGALSSQEWRKLSTRFECSGFPLSLSSAARSIVNHVLPHVPHFRWTKPGAKSKSSKPEAHGIENDLLSFAETTLHFTILHCDSCGKDDLCLSLEVSLAKILSSCGSLCDDDPIKDRRTRFIAHVCGKGYERL